MFPALYYSHIVWQAGYHTKDLSKMGERLKDIEQGSRHGTLSVSVRMTLGHTVFF